MKSARYEARIEIGDKEYAVLYTMQALADAERRTGKTISELASGAAANTLGVGDVASMFASGLEAARRAGMMKAKAFNMERTFKLMEQAGFAKVAATVFEGIGEVLGFDPDEENDEDELDPTDA